MQDKFMHCLWLLPFATHWTVREFGTPNGIIIHAEDLIIHSMN